MPRIRFCSIAILAVFFSFISLTDAATIALRTGATQQSEFEANLGESFEVEIFVDPDGESLVGVSIFLSFEDQFLEVIDAEPVISSIQPVKAGPLIPRTWQIFDNDTHGDPGNGLPRFQIDYIRLSIADIGNTAIRENEAVKEAGVVGRIRFRPLKATTLTTITFDSNQTTSRVTEATIVTGDNTQRQVDFPRMTPAQISITGGPLITELLPDLLFLMDGRATLDLSLFVTDSNDPNDRLKWEAVGNTNVTVNIHPQTHIATFGGVPGWVGEEEITLIVADAQGNAASDIIRVRIMSEPEISELPSIRARVRQDAPPINLNDFVRDLDAPNLVGLKWELTRGAGGLTVNLNGSIVTIRAEMEQFDTPLEFTATDADGNSASAAMFVTVLADVGGPVVRDLPDVIGTNDGLISFPPARDLDLDLYVVDLDFEPEQMQWTTEGNLNVIVDIDPNTRIPRFRSENGWTGTEEITFVATNPNNQQGRATVVVTLIDANAPPSLEPIPPLTLLVDEFEPIDLKQYVSDLNSLPKAISWETSGHEKVRIEIDDNGIATIHGEAGGMETVTLTAIDLDGNRASTEFIVTVIELIPPRIGELPDIRLKANDTLEAFDLDEFVTDPQTPVEEIQWIAEGFDEANLVIFISADHRVELTAQPNWHGEETVNFTATNQARLTATATARVVGTAAPIVTFGADLVEIPERWRISLQLDDHVEDADTPKEGIMWSAEILFSQSGELSGQITVTIDASSRSAIVETPEGSAGEYEATFTAVDSDGNSGQGVFRLRVIVLPKTPPVIAEIDGIVFTNDTIFPLDLNALVTDTDTLIQDIQWTTDGNTNIRVRIDEDDQATFSADLDFAGTETITITATDADEQSDSRTFNVTVKFPPKSPVIAALPNIVFHQRQTHRKLDLDDFLTDEDTLSSQIQWRATGQSTIAVEIDPESHLVTFKSITKEITREEITFTAEDADGKRASATTTVSVIKAPIPEPPMLSDLPDQSIRFSEIGTKQLSLLLSEFLTDDDTPVDELTWSVTGTGVDFDVEIHPLTLVATFKPSANFVGKKTLTFTVTDPEGQEGTDSLEFNLRIKIDPETHIVEITPNPRFLGQEVVTFTVTDSDELQTQGQVLIKVQPPDVNARPPVVAQPPPITLEAGGTSTLSLDSFVSDEDTPDALIRWGATGQEKIVIQIDPETRIATLELTPDAQDFRGSEIITLTATDPDGRNDSALLKVTVTDAADRTPPTFQIYVLPNPIQPEFLTIAVHASEPLQTKPTVSVAEKFV